MHLPIDRTDARQAFLREATRYPCHWIVKMVGRNLCAFTSKTGSRTLAAVGRPTTTRLLHRLQATRDTHTTIGILAQM
jgi:hypothetical protein